MFLAFPVELQPLNASSIHDAAKDLQGPTWQIFPRAKTYPEQPIPAVPKQVLRFFFKPGSFHHFVAKEEI